MESVNVLLNSIDAVKKFVDTVSGYECDMDMMTGSYIVDAKSIMGILSMDLLHPLEFRIHSDGSQSEMILNQIAAYIV